MCENIKEISKMKAEHEGTAHSAILLITEISENSNIQISLEAKITLR